MAGRVSSCAKIGGIPGIGGTGEMASGGGAAGMEAV
jgi:hypothetical protein